MDSEFHKLRVHGEFSWDRDIRILTRATFGTALKRDTFGPDFIWADIYVIAMEILNAGTGSTN